MRRGVVGQRLTTRQTCTACSAGWCQASATTNVQQCAEKTPTCPTGQCWSSARTPSSTGTTRCAGTARPTTTRAAPRARPRARSSGRAAAGSTRRPASTAARQECLPCPTGTFRAEESHRAEACVPWATCDGEGRFEATAPTATSDRACGTPGDCVADEYEVEPPTDTSARQCKALSSCGKDQKVAAASDGTRDIVCAVRPRVSPAHRRPPRAPVPHGCYHGTDPGFLDHSAPRRQRRRHRGQRRCRRFARWRRRHGGAPPRTKRKATAADPKVGTATPERPGRVPHADATRASGRATAGWAKSWG